MALLLRILRYGYRVPWLLWHLLIRLPVALLLIAMGQRGPDFEDRLDHRAIRGWSAGLVRIFGFRLQRVGTPLPGGTMFVANHVSWIDIVILHSQHMMGFVAKSEIRDWPLVGWLATRAQTIFHRRGSNASLGDVLGAMIGRLREGHAVAAFPEGGTRDGHALGPFHARIFLAAVEAGAPVQPVALEYGAGARAQSIVAFRARENFVQNFLRLLGEPARQTRVVFLEPIPPGEVEGRRRIAETARGRIAAALGQA